MANVGSRFELDELKRKAQAEKRAAQIRIIASNAVLVVILIAVAVGGKIGWDKWQAKREADRQAAEAAEIAAEKAAAERRKAEAEKAKALAEKRAAEKKAEEERREAERKAREEERVRREEERVRREEERRLAEERRAQQQELHRTVDKTVSGIRFQISDERLFCEYGLDDLVEVSVNEPRWAELSALVQKGRTIDFLDSLRGTTVTNEFSEEIYPDGKVVASLLANLDAERFTLVLRLKDEARTRRLALVAADEENGLAEPDGARQLKAGSRVVGWTIPFNFGDSQPIFLLNQASADRIAREWSARRRKLRSDAAKLDNRDEYVAERLRRELPDFVNSIKIEISTPPPEPEEPRAKETSSRAATSSRTATSRAARDDAKEDTRRERAVLRGGGSDIRTLGGARPVSQSTDRGGSNNRSSRNNNRRW